MSLNFIAKHFFEKKIPNNSLFIPKNDLGFLPIADKKIASF
jgi:hypothetical protein